MNRKPGMETTLEQHRKRRWTAMTALVAGGLLLAPAATWALPARAPLAQDETANRAEVGNAQVIAQGIARLPKGSAAWTITGGDVPDGAPTKVAAFPLGFAIADASSVAILDEAGTPLSILDSGEAAFLPAGKEGALQSFRGGPASLFQIALVSGDDATAGKAPGTVVGEPFATPEGRAFEIELASETLTTGTSSAIPVSRSGAPTLLLVTEGVIEVASPGGAPVPLNAGQFALLVGDVQISSSGAAPATYLFAAIGDAVGAPDNATGGAPKEKTGRAVSQATGAKKAGGGGSGGGGTGGGGAQPSGAGGVAPDATEKKPKGDKVKGDKPSEAGGATPTPITGGVETPSTAATPPAPVEEIPASPTAPVDDSTTVEDEIVVDQDMTPGKDAPDEVVQDTTPGDDTAATPPSDETGTDPSAGEGTGDETTPTESDQTTPADDTAADAPVDDGTGGTDPAIVDKTPSEPEQAAPADAAPVEEVPVDDGSAADTQPAPDQAVPADGGETPAP